MSNNKTFLIKEDGTTVEAFAPVIVSASRSTDIPGFYSEWFLHRLEAGYSAWTNPFNGVRSYVSYQNTRLIVFWSKNPAHLLDKGGIIDFLEQKGINCYVQFTLNDYESEGLERGVPSVSKRTDTFRQLVDRLGFGKVIWRFDPLVLTDGIAIEDLLKKIERIGNELRGYTEKLVFSFADISGYKKVQSNLTRNGISYHEFTEEQMKEFARGLQVLNDNWDFELATCGEKIDLQEFGIVHNKCVDDDLMIKYFSNDEALMSHLGVEIQHGDLFNPEKQIIKHRNNKDKGQRLHCGCIASKDIGEYNTCIHLCEYCYANDTKDVARANYRQHLANPHSETITGR